MDAKQVDVMVADASHEVYVDKILDTIREAANVRGTGIAERTHEYVTTKIIPRLLFTLQFPVESGRIEHRNINHIWGKHG